MSISAYKRLTLALGFLCLALMAAVLCELGANSPVMREESRVRNDFHNARATIFLFELHRDLAFKGDETNAVGHLYKLQPPSGPVSGSGANFIERERKRAANDVIAFLRSKTGRDLGDEPNAWILAYGNESLRKNQGAREEISQIIDEVRSGSYGKRTEQTRTNK